MKSNYFGFANFIKKSFVALATIAFIAGGFFAPSTAMAVVNVAAATNGTGISADKAANSTNPAGGAFTALGNIVITEVDKADISKNGTFTIAPPTGWTFDTTGVTTLVTGGLVVDVMSQTPALLTLAISGKNNSQHESFTIVGLQVRATNGANLLASGNITRAGGTAVVNGITNDVTNFGSLSQVVGAFSPTVSTVVISTGTVTTDGGVSTVTVTVKDQFGNPIPGIFPVISATGSGNTIVQPTVATNVLGQTTGSLQSTVAESKVVSVTVGGNPITQTATVNFNPGVLHHITVAPTGPQSVTTGLTIPFSAQGYDFNNNAIPGLSYSWAVVPGTGTGSVNSTGLFTADHPGTATVTATSGAITGSSGTITILKADQTISFGALSGKTYGDDPFTVSATVSSGLPVEFAVTSGPASITGNLVTITGAGTVEITATQGGNDYYNAATPVPQSFVVEQKSITVSAAADSKVYDGNANAVPTFTLAGIIMGDDVSASGSALFSDRNVGVGKLVTVSGVTLIGSDAGNYAYNTTATTNADITARPITVTAVTDIKVYDGNASSSGIPTIASGILVGGDTAVWMQVFDSKNIDTDKMLIPSGVVSDGNGGVNYAVTFINDATGEITARVLTVSATGINKVYDGNTDATVNLSDDRVSGDSLTTSYTTATFADKNVNAGIIISAAGISIVGTDAGNYTFNTTAATTANITARPITVTAEGKTKVYGQTDPVLDYDVTSGELVSGEEFTGELSRDAGEDIGEYNINKNTLTLGTNYDLTYVGAKLTISKAVAAVLATAENRVYDGGTDAAASLTVTGAVSDDTLTASYTSATFSNKNVGAGKTVTVSGITLNGTNPDNYSFNNTATAAADITALPISVTAVTDTKEYDGSTNSTGVPTMTSGSLATDDSVTWTQGFNNKNVGTGKTLIPTGTISDGNSGNNYAVTFVTDITGVITPKTLVISATGQNKPYDGNNLATVTLFDDRVSGDVLTTNYTSATFTDANVGMGKTVNVSGITVTGTDAENYVSNATAITTADITPLTISVTADIQTKVYGILDPVLGFTFTPALIGTDSFSGNLSRTSGENVGIYPINQGSLTLSSNYAINFTGANPSRYPSSRTDVS